MECDILDFSEYGNDADRRSDELLKKALEDYGARTRVVRITREGLVVSPAQRVWLRYDLRSFHDLFFVTGAAEALSAAGHLVFPSALSIRQSEDKWESYLALTAGAIPTVDTFPAADSGRRRGRAVVKPRVGWGGRGMRVVNGCDARESFLTADADNYVVQPFIDHGHTWTAAITGNGYEVLLEKRSKTTDFRTNSEFGEEAEFADDSGGLSELARRALDAFGLVTGTVDLMEVEGKIVVLEVNSAPCLWYDQLPGLDIAGPMARAVMEWFDGLERKP
jgi:glutathione synthase/RimK-type ligase-like ATP-grasp enzyme